MYIIMWLRVSSLIISTCVCEYSTYIVYVCSVTDIFNSVVHVNVHDYMYFISLVACVGKYIYEIHIHVHV